MKVGIGKNLQSICYLLIIIKCVKTGGKMEDLDNSWILLNNQVDCRNNDDNSPATLGLKNMRGVFILVGLVSRT